MNPTLRGLLNLAHVLLLIPVLLVKALLRRQRPSSTMLAFFHPYCNDGGGGERVLWCLVRAAMHVYGDRLTYRVYHGDAVQDADILRRVQERFGIALSQPVQFVRLSRRHWVESAQFPVLTLMGQALGSVVLALDALLCDGVSTPCYMFDSMGYGFAYPVFALVGGCTVLSYTHYPMISSDMLNRVLERRPQYNNNDAVAASATLSHAKWLYYRVFAWAYGLVGRWSQLSIVNSRWTANHIRAIWGVPVHVVYPAVDTQSFEGFALEKRDNVIISVAQFRPEKDHALQLRAMAALRDKWRARFGSGVPMPRLLMIGSVRNAGDAEVVARLKELAATLGLAEGREFDFALNQSFAELKQHLARARVGLHTMWNEHFGIGVVELMAAGVVTVAHNSGGPRMDIVVPCDGNERVGFLAETPDEYADCIVNAFALGDDTQLQRRARVAARRFSEQSFDAGIVGLLARVIKL